mmetsp:Transcript_19601/g.42391  ORF Transcript_19601/g.42391 Transcript_19601/m.42391 type:complete len:211 (-) Transcript_19601:294-926(-)
MHRDIAPALSATNAADDTFSGPLSVEHALSDLRIPQWTVAFRLTESLSSSLVFGCLLGRGSLFLGESGLPGLLQGISLDLLCSRLALGFCLLLLEQLLGSWPDQPFGSGIFLGIGIRTELNEPSPFIVVLAHSHQPALGLSARDTEVLAILQGFELPLALHASRASFELVLLAEHDDFWLRAALVREHACKKFIGVKKVLERVQTVRASF